ncbi:MAG: hypothetical protein ACRDEA_09620 [Microcystaceae cyanobacterium]
MNQQPRNLGATRSKSIASASSGLPQLPGLDPSRSQTFYGIALVLLLVSLASGVGLASQLNSSAMNPSPPIGGDLSEVH